MYRNVDTHGLSAAELQAARHDIVTAITDEVAGRGIDTAVFCDVPGGLPGPGVLLDGRHDAAAVRGLRADRSRRIPLPPSVPEAEHARLVWAHVDGDRWRSCWPECQRVHVLWRDDALSIPGADLARRIADRRVYKAAMEDYAGALVRLLTEIAASMWSDCVPTSSRPDGPDRVTADEAAVVAAGRAFATAR